MYPCSLGPWVRAQGDTYQVVADVSQYEPPDIVVTTSNGHVAIRAEKVRSWGAAPVPQTQPPTAWGGGQAPALPRGAHLPWGELGASHWGNWELASLRVGKLGVATGVMGELETTLL